jgi:ATP-dependent Clp protease ATP-binding subunit ClpC
MFERYTEKARRVIFFARYEASQFGSSYIETEHLLLGMLREDKALTNRFLRSRASVESIRKQIEAHTTMLEPVSTSIDLPLSNECKRVLAYAGEEAERLSHKHIGTEHLLLGLLREEKCFGAQILKDRGVQLGAVREEIGRIPQESAARGPLESTPLTGVFRDLTQAAIDGQLEPIVGRDLELDSILEIFSNCRNKNPVLIGERGAGKTAIVEGVAQRIADGAVPSFLADKRILAFEPELIAGWAKERHGFEELTKVVKAQKDPSEVILFLDELDGMLVSTSRSGSPSGIFKHALLHEEIQCIGVATPNGYREATQAIPWLEQCFRTIHVRPLDEERTLSVLLARKHRLEKFHQVTYTDEALECAAHSFGRHLPGSQLRKALELLDAAGSRVKLRQHSPQEVADCLKRVKSIGQRFESAIVNHEFEKAKFYSDEERKEKENLRVLREKHHLDDSSSAVVGREDVEQMLSRWATYPFCP